METLEDLEWCLEQLETTQTDRSVSDLATNKVSERMFSRSRTALLSFSKETSFKRILKMLQTYCIQWCTTDRRQHRLPTSGPTIGSFSATPASTVRELASTLTRTCQSLATFGESCRAVLPLFASYAPSGVKSQLPCSNHWLPRLFCLT